MKKKHTPSVEIQLSASTQQSLAPAESLTPAPTSLVPADLGYQPLAPEAVFQLPAELTLALEEHKN